MLAMGQGGKFDGSSHITRVGHRSCQLINRVVTAFHDSSRNQSHAGANRVYWNQVQPLALVRRELTEVGPQQVRKRSGSIDALVPSAKRLLDGSFDDGGPDDRDRQAGSVLDHQ